MPDFKSKTTRRRSQAKIGVNVFQDRNNWYVDFKAQKLKVRPTAGHYVGTEFTYIYTVYTFWLNNYSYIELFIDHCEKCLGCGVLTLYAVVPCHSVKALCPINEVALHQTGLVLGWVTACRQVNHLGM